MRLVWLAAAALAACGAAAAHPHGSVDCRADVRMDQGALQSLRGELLLDAEHSRQALALVRDGPEQAPDPARLQRLAFALKMQLARFQWLFALDADGAAVPLAAAEPRLETAGERLLVSVDLRPATTAPGAAQWRLRCADPTWYWLAELQAPLVQGCGSVQRLQAGPGGAAGFGWRCAAGFSP